MKYIFSCVLLFDFKNWSLEKIFFIRIKDNLMCSNLQPIIKHLYKRLYYVSILKRMLINQNFLIEGITARNECSCKEDILWW